MGTSRRRIVGIVLACCTFAVACADGTNQPFTTPNATMVDGLSVLPRGGGTVDSVAITINDYASAATAMDVEPPPAGATEGEARDWVVQLFGGRLDLRFPEFLGVSSLTAPDVVVTEFGWSPYDIVVSAESLPLVGDGASGHFTVLKGDLSWSDALVLRDGVGTIGDDNNDDDDTPSAEQRSESRPLGMSLQIGERDGQIAAAASADRMRAWVAGDFDDAGSDPGLRSAAERLDAVGAYTAQLIRTDFGAGDGDDLAAGGIAEPFEVLAIGLSGEFADLESTLVYVFADEPGAGRAVGQITDAWNGLDLSGIDGTFEIVTIEQRDDAVVVIGRVEDGPTSDVVFATAADAGLLRHD